MHYFLFYCRLYTPPGKKIYRRKEFISAPKNSNLIEESDTQKAIKLVMYVSLLVVVLSLQGMIIGNYIHAAQYATENTLTEQLITGTFDTRGDGDIHNSASVFFTKMAGQVFAIALPFMSAFALTMITLSLISSIIFLTKPDLFEEVHVLVQNRKGTGSGGKGLNNLMENYRKNGMRDFILSYCIDFKSWAFQDSVTAGVDGEPTFQDFFRSMPKYIAMFTFCILITNRVLLDFLMTGAKLTASLVEKVTYDIDYVEKMENFIDQGKRYTPQQWTGKGRENTNKMSVYRSIYNTVIANLEQEQKDTESLLTIGMAVEDYIMTSVEPLEHWDRKVFSARTEYVPTKRSEVPVPHTYFVSGADIGMTPSKGTAGYVMLYIRSETDDRSFANVGTTRYPSAWGTAKPPTEFDITQIPGVITTASSPGKTVEYDVTVGTVLIVTITGEAYNATADLTNTRSTGKIGITYGANITEEIKKNIKSVTINSIKASTLTRTSGQTVGGQKNTIVMDKPVWVNPELTLPPVTEP